MPKAPSNVSHFDLVESGIERNGVPIGGPCMLLWQATWLALWNIKPSVWMSHKKIWANFATTKSPSSHPQMVVIVREFRPKMPETFRFRNHSKLAQKTSGKLLCDSLVYTVYTDRNTLPGWQGLLIWQTVGYFGARVSDSFLMKLKWRSWNFCWVESCPDFNHVLLYWLPYSLH